jgi:predicted acyl esterase
LRRAVRWSALLALAALLWRLAGRHRGKGQTTAGEKPGWRYAVERVRGIIAPRVEIMPPPSGVRFERDVEVAVRDGTILRVNVFRPEREGSYPVILCAHPYGKDNLPKRGPFGYLPPAQYRMIRQPEPVSWSAWTSWEAPDPAYWVPRGYAVVNCDLRGFGASEGRANLLTDAEARDVHDVIEWAGTRPWSNGRVGMNGVSYLAISQYGAAALRPPHLAAICPWEGFTDVYRDFARPGGIRENGFIRVWNAGIRRQGRIDEDLREGQVEHALRDGWWAARTPELERIEVPILVCGSFSDQELHSRGSFRAFERVGSSHRWLYTHRGGKWAKYYSEEALALQRRFFDHFLKDEQNGMPEVPPVRLEVREDRDTIHAVRAEPSWPLPQTRWTDLYLGAEGRLSDAPVAGAGTVHFDTDTGRAGFTWEIQEDTEVTGPMALRLFLEARGAEDVYLFVGVQKLRAGRVVPFEGSYGYGFDRVATGWLKASLRKLDPDRSTPLRPAHTYDEPRPLKPEEVVAADVALLPSATFFRKGEQLRLVVQGRWFSTRNPLLGQFPAAYERGPRGSCILHCGGEHRALLRIPVIPPQTSSG